MSGIKFSKAAFNAVGLFFIVYATMFFFGLIENIKGVSFPLIKAEFGVSYDNQGGMVSMTWFGYVLFCLIASLFLQRYGSKRALQAGYLLICAGSAATLFALSFWFASLTLMIVNAGFGFFEVGTNALSMIVFKKRAALMMNLLHFFYGFGAFLGPKMAGFLTGRFEFTWRQVYLTIIIPTAICFLIAIWVKFQEDGEGKSDEKAVPKITFIDAIKNPIVWMFAFTLGFMEVIEFGAANWGGLFLQDVYGLDPRTTGANFVALFYIIFTLSRLLSGIAIEKIGYMRSLFISVESTAILFAVGFILGRKGIWILPLTGLFIAVMWPLIMAVILKTFGTDAPVASSAVITISGAINGVFQLVIGMTNQHIGEAWGYRSCLMYTLLTLVLLYLLSKKISRTWKCA